MAKHSKIGAIRGRRIELRNLVRGRIAFGLGLAYPLNTIQKIGLGVLVFFFVTMLVAFAGAGYYFALELGVKVGGRLGSVVAVGLFVVCFVLAIGLLNFFSGRIQNTLKQTPPKH